MNTPSTVQVNHTEPPPITRAGKYDNLRPVISFNKADQKVYHNSQPCKVVLRKNKISVGCSDITPEAAKFIYERWLKEFGSEAEREVAL